jgi:hypothetical protein
MKPRDWRNVLLVAFAAALCFGGSFTCSTNDDDDDNEINGHVSINAMLVF